MYDTDKQDILPNGHVTAVDPGDVSPITTFGTDGISISMDGTKELMIMSKRKIDEIQSQIKINKKLTVKEKKHNHQLRQKIRLMEFKHTNWIKDMHYKVIKHLLPYSTILIPEFKTKQMINKKRKLCKAVRRTLQSISHYRFRMRLKDKAAITTGSEIVICNESYTSKTCSRCFYQSLVERKRMLECKKCGLNISRDMNGAKNILIKNYMAYYYKNLEYANLSPVTLKM